MPLVIYPLVCRPSNNLISDPFLLVVKLYNLSVFVLEAMINFSSKGVYTFVIKSGILKYLTVISEYFFELIFNKALLKSTRYSDEGITFNKELNTLNLSGLIATLSS